MKIETLVSTMNKSYNDEKFLDRMMLKGNVIVCNQTDQTSYYEYSKNKKIKKIYSTKEIGIGRSRNTLLLYSSSDICILSDDDMIFEPNYEEIVEYEFKIRPEADVLIFNIDDGGHRKKTKKDTNVNYLNFTQYGAARLVFKRNSILNNGIFFSMNFGGGASFGSGEDTLFLKTCLDKKLKIVAINSTISKLTNVRPSTWFTGYNEKYFLDKGALYFALFKYTHYIRMIIFSFRNYQKSKFNYIKVFKLMYKGKRMYKEKLNTKIEVV